MSRGEDATSLGAIRETSAAADKIVDVIVIGAGFSGLYAVEKLARLGFDVLGIERGDDVGGVWFWNRYPGARCDCESYYYSYSFSEELEQDWSWSLRYSEQPEILRYLSHVADRFALRQHYRFSTSVESMELDEEKMIWRVRTSDGLTTSARFVISAAGCLSEPKRPDIPGLDTFEGEILNTSSWPRDEPQLAGRRVGVIGTGASGVQVVSRLASHVASMVVFQRTANWVIPVWNGPTEMEFEAWVKKNYKDIRARCLASNRANPFDAATAAVLETDADECARILEKHWAFGGPRFFTAFTDSMRSEEANKVIADFVRDRIHHLVHDTKVAEMLTPDHPIATRRPPMDDDYYATFNRSNVTLVDLRSTPITGMSGGEVRTSTARHALDLLILATGFDAITGPLLAMNIAGRGGRKLNDNWAAGARSYLGIGMAGYPNLFTVTGPLSPSVTANMPTHIEQSVDWIVDCLVSLRDKGQDWIEATEVAQDAWCDEVDAAVGGTLYATASSWYDGSNIPGKPRRFGVYLGGFGNYRRRCNEIADAGYEGFLMGAGS
ncbi:MAG: NAD(P)/FAD-dependent oxidoreductase [Sphingomonadales bacterium]|nr:MAG: NAD(P)/FAD-dependent oxidoreductase [Sphingomonadales bacterium]